MDDLGLAVGRGRSRAVAVLWLLNHIRWLHGHRLLHWLLH